MRKPEKEERSIATITITIEGYGRRSKLESEYRHTLDRELGLRFTKHEIRKMTFKAAPND